ncbi:MAG: GNAT family N-acetyltransferase [Candidatus Saccharibacteria bacterium]|nr:GNAT family N-acetyltransferase [Candidatus Saccharibacteria bacterium]
MNIFIHKASESDIEAIQEFGSKLLNYERENYDPSLNGNWAFSNEAKERYLNAIRNEYVIIAEIDGQPVGFLIGKIIEPKVGNARQVKQAYLQNIYVNEDLRKAGVGKELIENFKKYCRNNNVEQLNVSVLAANETAVDFYEAIGFEPQSLNLSQKL